jgi:hypothetical protein
LEHPRGANANVFVLGLQLSALKVEDQKKKKLLQPFLQFSSLELESFKRGQGKLSCLG